MTNTADSEISIPDDKELRSRVRLFGNMLGEVLLEQAGADVLAAVETLRKSYIRLRKQDNPALPCAHASPVSSTASVLTT